ncbi:hypothetical protein AB0G48_21030 [Streptomyces rubiginosohelvolus]|uniref:hypothetical protein n=1 Tax=Streptomyces rubiginosohelvolus TaxID=67362 RepID=UPI0033C8D933
MTENRVTFTRIGRQGGRDGSPAPEPIVRALSGEQLANSIAMYARRFLASPSFEVVYDTETGRGFILAGFHTAGEFTVTAAAQTGGA